MSQMVKQVSHIRQQFQMNKMLRRELHLIRNALASDWIDMCRSLGHLIQQQSSGIGYSDSCRLVAGGFSFCIRLWWYYEWPDEIQSSTLKYK